ncbi:MAG: asparagine synthase (glutamine-hydrolyzing) [Terriglobales bacterium]
MCGLVGFLGGRGDSADAAASLLQQMADRIRHRGPDDSGHWYDPVARIGFGHRRLSIVDLSPAGRQPMHSDDGRYIVAYNGEIYNHLELRRDLEKKGATSWRGHSDTETLLRGFEIWGVPGTIERAIGMFAIAIWDRETTTLTLIRDRLGEKPLYYGWQGGGQNAVFLFGSELNALRAHPAFGAAINRDAIYLLIRQGFIEAPHSIYQGISKVPAACMVTVSMRRPEPQVARYWNAAQVAMQGAVPQFEGSEDAAVDQLEALLKSAVRQQMVADVPLGAFLSGGVDSSAIVALMQSQSSAPVKTFTIGSSQKEYNEAVHAKAVAQHLGTEHTELYLEPQQVLDLVPQLSSIYDEPFADSSQIPTFLVSKLARQHVTVALSGDAGDELFCGYRRYRMTQELWGRIALLPSPVRTAISRGITLLSPQAWNRIAHALGTKRAVNWGDKLYKGRTLLASKSVDELYGRLLSPWGDPSTLVVDGAAPQTFGSSEMAQLTGLDPLQRMMVRDIITYLPGDILAKVDRAAMAASLETRVPMLDHRVVEFALSLPQSLKLRDGQTKWALRQVLYRYVPKNLIERPKQGFGVPIGSWLRGPLREWAESLLDESRLRGEGYFHPAPIRQKWEEHLSGQRNWQYHLWDVLMFQAWLETNKQ